MPEPRTISQELFDFHKSTPQKKSDPKFGKLIADKILLGVTEGTTGYYHLRNKKFDDLRKLAQGRHSMTEFLDLLGIDGKQAFVKLDMTPPAILPKFLDIVVERFMELEERPSVTAVDSGSRRKKQKDKDEAEFAMNMSGVIQGLQDEAGVPLVDPNKHIPSSYEELELYFESEYRLPEEIKFEKKILDTLMDGGYEVFKRQMLYDLIEVGIAWAYVYKDNNGNKKYRRCDPDAMIYAYSKYDDFRDCTVVGELEKMKVSDLRALHPEIDEKVLFEMFSKTYQDGRVQLHWTDDFRFSLVRPYDDALIEVFHFQVVTTEDRMWVEKTDKRGKTVINEKREKPQRLGDNKTLIEKRLHVVYSGCYSKSTGEMVEWKVMENMIKPHYSLHEAFTNYVGFMPNNRDMTNMSLTERSITAIRMLSLIQLKKQHLIAKMRPDGMLWDINSLRGVNLGLGSESETPMRLQEQFDQTGNAYYNSLDEDGETRKGPPITPINSNGNAAALQALDNEYQFWLEKLRNDLGTNEYVEGQAVNPKLGLGVMENQVAASNRATNFIYRGYLSILEGIAKRIAIMDWYDVAEDGDPEYGIEPGEFMDKIFDISIDMAPTDKDRNYIEAMAQTAVTAGIITFEESIKVRRLAKQNVKLAEVYLSLYESKRKKQAQEEAAANAQVTAQVQQQSAMAKAQMDAQLLQMKSGADMEKQRMANDGAKTNTLGTIVNTVLSEWLKTGKSIEDMPPSLQAIVGSFMTNVVGSQQLQSAENQQQAMAMQQQAQQAMEQEQAEQEGGQMQ